MLTRLEHEHVTWADLSSPTQEEIREVMEAYGIPPELVGDLSGPVPRSEAVQKDHAVKITLDFPTTRGRDITDVETTQEIKFLITKKTLITARYEDSIALHKFSKEFEVLTTLKRTAKDTHGGSLFVALMHTLYDHISAKLDYIDSHLTFIEHEIFEEREREMVFEISRTSQTLITIRQILASHKDVLEDSEKILINLFNKDFKEATEELRNHHQFLYRRVSTLAESLKELRDTNNSLITTKQNEVMKVLTIMAFVTFPLTLISSLFSMNTDSTPLVGHPFDFWIILSAMAVLTVSFFSYFKYKRWF